MSHKLSELGIQHDGFICFNNPNEVVSDKEFEEIKKLLSKYEKRSIENVSGEEK